MEFYAASKGNINPADLELFAKIRSVLEAMPNVVFDPTESRWGTCRNQVTCHLLCRALAKCLSAKAHDDHFVTRYQHTWIVPKSRSSIIDAYPVAGAAPFIVSYDHASPWRHLYERSNTFSAMFTTTEFREQLRQTTQAVRATMRQLGT